MKTACSDSRSFAINNSALASTMTPFRFEYKRPNDAKSVVVKNDFVKLARSQSVGPNASRATESRRRDARTNMWTQQQIALLEGLYDSGGGYESAVKPFVSTGPADMRQDRQNRSKYRGYQTQVARY